jgi:hypothetical protein
VQFGEFEVAVHQCGDAGRVGADALQTLHHLLLPPLVGRPAVAVGNAQKRRREKGFG